MQTARIDYQHEIRRESISIPLQDGILEGFLTIPPYPLGVVVFVHGSASSRFSPRNRCVADYLVREGFGTLLFDLLTREEEMRDEANGMYRFNILFLAERLTEVLEWFRKTPEGGNVSIGLFGASTGAAAALMTAAFKPQGVKAVVSRGGRPDMVLAFLSRITVPVFLIVGGDDTQILELNCHAFREIKAEKKLHVVPGAGHLFEEAAAMEEVARVVGDWFKTYF